MDSTSDTRTPPPRQEEPRSTTASPPYSDAQSDWGLQTYPEDYPLELDYTCSLWNAGAEELTSDFKVLCTICHKNLVQVQEVALMSRRKRRRQDAPPVLSYMTVCQDCARLPPSQLCTAPEKSKLVVKRQRAKARVPNEESETLKKLRDQQMQLLEKCKDLPENERKRIQQIVRNRISAQQSRDRKKMILTQIESTNKDLAEENERLKAKIEELIGENRYLRGQLERYTTEPESGGGYPRIAGMMALGLVATMMIVMLVQTPSPMIEIHTSAPRSLSSSTSLMEYRNPQDILRPQPSVVL